jgi:hypothetical protein
MKKQPGCERLPMRTPLGAVPVLVPPIAQPKNFRRQREKMLVEEAEFQDWWRRWRWGGSVWESKDYLQCGRAQQEASEGGIQQRAAAGTSVLWFLLNQKALVQYYKYIRITFFDHFISAWLLLIRDWFIVCTLHSIVFRQIRK